jgi:hypothetical protein
MIAGVLTSRCGTAGSNRVLGVDSNGNLGLFASGVPGPDNVTWYLGQGFAPNGAPLGGYLRNKQSGGYLRTIWKDGILAPSLGIGPLTSVDEWSTWSFGGPTNSGFVAVRPFGDDHWNLNILGGCGNTSVGLWGWSGGDANEIWNFAPDPVAVPQPSYYRIIAKCGGWLSVNPATNQVFYDGTFKRPATQSVAVDQYLWQVEVAIGKSKLEQVEYPLSGFSIISALKNQAIRANGDGQSVSLVNLGQVDTNSAWDTNGDDGEGRVALRPMSDDDQNLNISGGCGGTAVITYGWQGGAWNELWKFLTP